MGNNTSSRRRKLKYKEDNKWEKVENRKAFIINLVFFITVLLLIYFIIKYALVWLLPFVIGFGIAFILKPLIRKISNKYSLNSKLVAGILVTLFYLTVGVVLAVAIIKISVGFKELFMSLPNLYINKMEPGIYELIDKIEESANNLDPALVEGITDIAMSFAKSIVSMLTNMSAGFAKVVSSVPSIFIIFIFSIISSYFIAMDYNLITTFITRQFPKKVSSTIFEVKNQIVDTIFKLVKSYTILMSMTFVELSIGFIILRINNPLQLAFIIAIVDILPILGTGGILVPWSIISLIKGDLYLGIGIAILYIVILVVRNIVEPKLVGKQIGLHPLIMLICMYIGIKLFGFLGIFILPLLLIIFINVNNICETNMIK